MNNIFYNSVSIILGLILLYFGIVNLMKKTYVFSILTLIHYALFIFFGIGGFFLPDEYSYITILSLLALCITMAICIVTLNKKDDKKTKANKKSINKK